jgi:uncharacterized protein YndB with AHSA1/START domain
MANYNATVSSPKSPEEAFDYLADFTNATEWDPNTSTSECVEGVPGTVGSRYRVVTEFGGREMELTYETVEVDRPRRVVLRSGNSSTEIVDTMTFEPTASGTDVKYDANVTPKGLVKLIDPILSLMFKRVGDRAAEGLRRSLA